MLKQIKRTGSGIPRKEETQKQKQNIKANKKNRILDSYKI